MKKIRLSHSLISLWEKGDVDGAVRCYFHLDQKGTRQMEEGKKFHQEISEHLNKFNCLPEYMQFNGKFITPKSEHEVVVSYNKLFDLKGVFDCLDEPKLYEFKTGISNALEWTRTAQIPLYLLICQLAGVKVDTAYLLRYNQYQKKTDLAIVHNNSKIIDYAANIVDTVGPDIYAYFEREGLL